MGKVTKGRMSAPKKEAVVLRLLSGQAIDGLARELKISVREIEEWKRLFLMAGREGLKARGLDPVTKELEMAKRTIGDLTMELNMHKKKQRLLESGSTK